MWISRLLSAQVAAVDRPLCFSSCVRFTNQLFFSCPSIDPTLYSCVCAHAYSPSSPSLLSICTHVISSLTFPSISAPLICTHTTPSAPSFHSPHLPSHQVKYGAGAGRARASGPHLLARPRAAPVAAGGKPAPITKPPCWRSRCCCCQPAGRGWSRARDTAALSSPSPCTCPTCPPS